MTNRAFKVCLCIQKHYRTKSLSFFLKMHKIAKKFDPEGKKHAVEKAMSFALKGNSQADKLSTLKD